MKIRIKALRQLIREASSDVMYMSTSEAEDFIANKNSDTVAKATIADSDTGEIYVEAGEEYGSSRLHPDDIARLQQAREDTASERASAFESSDEEDWEREQELRGTQLEDSWKQAVSDFAESWSSFSSEMTDIKPEDAASDAAEGFFYEYQNDWQKWARHLHVSKQTMKNIIADYVYEAMINGND